MEVETQQERKTVPSITAIGTRGQELTKSNANNHFVAKAVYINPQKRVVIVQCITNPDHGFFFMMEEHGDVQVLESAYNRNQQELYLLLQEKTQSEVTVAKVKDFANQPNWKANKPFTPAIVSSFKVAAFNFVNPEESKRKYVSATKQPATA